MNACWSCELNDVMVVWSSSSSSSMNIASFSTLYSISLCRRKWNQVFYYFPLSPLSIAAFFSFRVVIDSCCVILSFSQWKKCISVVDRRKRRRRRIKIELKKRLVRLEFRITKLFIRFPSLLLACRFHSVHAMQTQMPFIDCSRMFTRCAMRKKASKSKLIITL